MIGTTQQAHDHEFLVIAKIARDFLAIPGASVSVERLFSSSRHICQDLWSSLQSKTIAELLLSKKWLGVQNHYRAVMGMDR